MFDQFACNADRGSSHTACPTAHGFEQRDGAPLDPRCDPVDVEAAVDGRQVIVVEDKGQVERIAPLARAAAATNSDQPGPSTTIATWGIRRCRFTMARTRMSVPFRLCESLVRWR